MVQTIISPHGTSKPAQMFVREFKEKFKNTFSEDFDKISKYSISDFIDKNNRHFEKHYDAKHRMVIKTKILKKSKSKKHSKGHSAENRSLYISENEYITAESENISSEESSDEEISPNSFLENYLLKKKSNEICDDSLSDSDENTQSMQETTKAGEWTEVRRRRGRSHSSLIKKPGQIRDMQQQQHHILYERTVSEDEMQYLLSKLLLRKESHDLIIKESAGFYVSFPYELAKDIVGLWNTPARSLSYIVVGLDQAINFTHLNKILSLDYFTTLPHFQYFEFEDAERPYGIFEIPSSYGTGQPSITKSKLENLEKAVVFWDSNQLFFRNSASTTPLSLSDPQLAMIYQWFAGNRDNGSTTKQITKSETRVGHEISSSSANMLLPVSNDSKVEMKKEPLEIFRNVVKEFRKGKYILLAGNVPTGINNLEAISTVPWMYVFDFDTCSRDSGLLSINEPFIRKRRSLHLSNWRQQPGGISETGTTWTFLRGRRDNPESMFKYNIDIRGWFQEVKCNMDLHIEQIQKYIEDYTVVSVVVFWPIDELMIQHMHKLLIRMDEGLDPKPMVVLCIAGKPATDIGNSVLTLLKTELGDNLTVIECELNRICKCIIDITKHQQIVSRIKYSLPTADDFDDPSIEDADAAWLREELEVLYLSNPYTKCKQDVKSLEEEGDNFFRGGTLRWFAWYEVGHGHFDAERDLMSNITRKIKANIDENRSGKVTLCHAPGSGGTTLAQRILWDFHKDVPCAQVKLRSSLPISSLVERIEMVYAKTHKPVLLLIDGDDEGKVKQLNRILKINSRCCSIILYVKRYPYKVTGNHTFLNGTVSIQEAKRLALKFKNQCREDAKKQEQLSKLCDDVENGKEHQVYEFGLATYLHEYLGIEKYVKGYLWPFGKKVTDFTTGRKILCFLSLAYYYGQVALPLQFFCGLIKKPSNYLVEMDDLPEPVSQFVVFDKNECKTNNIRICHYFVAKEILEQVLGNGSKERTSQLCPSAKQKLADICEQFIAYASRKSVKAYNIVYILARMFIFRDNIDIGENAEQTKKKPLLSRLVLDIHSKGPLFTERLNVLKKLTEAFPNDQNFHAHLGRFYAYFRPGEEDEAEKCLQKATAICEKQIGNKSKEELDEKLLQSLMHIYHIYGTIFQKRIAKYTGQSPTDEPEIETDDEAFDDRLDELIRCAKYSSEYFEKCRFYTPDGFESCFGFVGEITVRLQICDFIERNFRAGQELSGIKGYLSSNDKRYSTGKKFVQKSVYCIDNLLMECLKTVDEEDIDHSVQRVIFWYNHLFSKHAVNLEDLAKGDDIHAYRLQIAAKKLKYSRGEKNLIMLERISEKEDITLVVQLYENIFRETVSVESKAGLDRDHVEWMFAIRHRLSTPPYPIETVLMQVRKWQDTVHSPMSKFYLFILTSLLGFGKKNTNGSSEFLSEANLLKRDLERVSKYVLKPKYPREWLRKEGEGIKLLEPGTRFLGYVKDDRNLKGDVTKSLRICKGTICAPNNKKLAGFISLDLGNNVVPVRVFYVPYKANLASTAHSEKRVEFILGFSLDHGWDAFNVRLLETYSCPKPRCTARVEVTSADDEVRCPVCQKTSFREAFVMN
ncbi:uncharacterized protein LOC144617832 isoform X2 [Crassostrea virginica]